MKNVRRNSATLFSVLLLFGFTVSSCSNAQSDPQLQTAIAKSKVEKLVDKTVVPTLDTSAYRKKFNAMLNGDSSEKWKFKGDFPLAGAWLPQHRVIAYYGNLYSTRMGILGELPKPQMFAKLKGELVIHVLLPEIE